MINKTRIMLYVENVDTISTFWQTYFQAKQVEENLLPQFYKNIVLELNSTTELSIFPSEFIKQYSPEVENSFPSLMLFTDNFEDLHEQLPETGEIRETNGIKTFNFADPEGNYFVVSKS